jgi:hypothetical protein
MIGKPKKRVGLAKGANRTNPKEHIKNAITLSKYRIFVQCSVALKICLQRSYGFHFSRITTRYVPHPGYRSLPRSGKFIHQALE